MKKGWNDQRGRIFVYVSDILLENSCRGENVSKMILNIARGVVAADSLTR